ncbi:hypothetical protein CALCODRAFT_23094 [Calocera cornea HHB12733]|uniref:Uncharacterized protein n=1 Tax=Calocera cornea HHB12733 TaxID=1353952 RepID=A0A165E5L9_9BASI|nr:hypothetical protein CALCODRAFT_23094 [Calocera cornea HHB12733]
MSGRRHWRAREGQRAMTGHWSCPPGVTCAEADWGNPFPVSIRQERALQGVPRARQSTIITTGEVCIRVSTLLTTVAFSCCSIFHAPCGRDDIRVPIRHPSAVYACQPHPSAAPGAHRQFTASHLSQIHGPGAHSVKHGQPSAVSETATNSEVSRAVWPPLMLRVIRYRGCSGSGHGLASRSAIIDRPLIFGIPASTSSPLAATLPSRLLQAASRSTQSRDTSTVHCKHTHQ